MIFYDQNLINDSTIKSILLFVEAKKNDIRLTPELYNFLFGHVFTLSTPVVFPLLLSLRPIKLMICLPSERWRHEIAKLAGVNCWIDIRRTQFKQMAEGEKNEGFVINAVEPRPLASL